MVVVDAEKKTAVEWNSLFARSLNLQVNAPFKRKCEYEIAENFLT